MAYSLYVISDAIALYELVSKKWEQFHILSALFRWDGTRIEGDEQLSVQIHKAGDNEKAWYYSLKEIPNYVFIRIPVNAGGVLESLGSPGDGADSRYFRYIAVPDGRIYGGPIHNVKVDFMVFGYRPKDLLHKTGG